MLDFSRLSFPPLCTVSNQGGAADQGCESPWDSGDAHHGGDTEQLSWQGMYSETTDFDEEILSAKTFEHKNRFQAIAVRNEDCVDDATTNMENGKNIIQRSLMMNSDVNKHPEAKKIHTLQRAAKKEKSIRVCSDGKRSWQRISVAVGTGACDNVINPKDLIAKSWRLRLFCQTREFFGRKWRSKSTSCHPREDIERHHIPGRWSVERFAQCEENE